MTFIEPIMPSMPVNVTGTTQPSAQEAVLRQVRAGTCYRGARLALKAAFVLETCFAVVAVAFCTATRHGWVPLLGTVGGVALLAASYAALECGVSLLDVADAQMLRPRHRVDH